MSHRKYGLDHLGCRTARRLVSPALALWLCSQPFAARADLYFNPRFLADDPAAVADLSGFEKGQEVPPGTYRVDIYLNNGYMTTRDVTFQADAQGPRSLNASTNSACGPAWKGVNATSPSILRWRPASVCMSCCARKICASMRSTTTATPTA